MAEKLAFSITISPETGAWLDAFSIRMGTTRNSAINFFLRMGIDAYEDAMKRIDTAMKEGGEKDA